MNDGDIIKLDQTVNGCSTFLMLLDNHKWRVKYFEKMVIPRFYEYDIPELIEDSTVIGNIFNKETPQLDKKILCLTCKHCNEGEIVDETIAMFKCDVYGLKVIGVFGCNDYEKETRDKITQSQEA